MLRCFRPPFVWDDDAFMYGMWAQFADVEDAASPSPPPYSKRGQGHRDAVYSHVIYSVLPVRCKCLVRASRLAEFNSNKLCRVLVVSITAGGQGLDFTAASNVVFVELPESPAWLRQAEDRLHRRRQVRLMGSFVVRVHHSKNPLPRR